MFIPKLYTVLRLGYGRGNFRHDFIAGLTVAIIALPQHLRSLDPVVVLISGGALALILLRRRFAPK